MRLVPVPKRLAYLTAKWTLPHVVSLLGAIALLTGCASGVHGKRQIPERFTLSIAIPAGIVPANPHDVPLLEPAWYLLDADGTLRASMGQPKTGAAGSLPPIIRTVPHAEREALWQRLDDAGMFRPNNVGLVTGDASHVVDRELPTGVTNAPGTGMVGVWWTSGERRRSFGVLPVPLSYPDTSDRPDADVRAQEAWRALAHAIRTFRAWAWRPGVALSTAETAP